ncbi:type II/IV secretion system family protein [Orientia tsutsugamushi str. TA763]|nr:type II/IV secretion system family protein [Orientia tsutsugamushi str. TA763]
MFASLSSQTSYFVSKMLENHLLPAYEGLSSRKTGIMFGAKAVAKIRDVQIHDPVTLTNTKEFLRQCFMKPYIIGNILGKKAAAQQTNDIIGFIEQNIPNNFGIYYREPSNLGISFKTCRQATPLIKVAIHKELNEGLLTNFAAAIGVQSDQSHMLSQRLKVMTGDTLKYLQREQQDIHEWMKQAMLLNANRESYDDWREKFSLSRIYPNLVSMHAIRGLFQKSFSYLVAGEMAAHMMPILQSVFFAVVVSMIFIVFPMGLLPGGYNILKTWILLIIWVSSWPVFFTIIHCLGMISLSSKSGAFGSDYGLNMLSQGSFAEMILYSYATFQMLASSIPMLSWSVIKACAHATANLASQFSPIQVASSLGSNIVDNNLSMDNYSIGNRTISQQNLAPSLDMTDSIINYGSHKIIIGNNGEQFVIQTVDSIGVIISIVFFTAQGKKTIIKAKIRGADFVGYKCLAKMLKSAKKASKICFGGLPLVKNSERLHILITGTTGTGKTNMLNELLPQIRLHKDRAIIVDTTGAFTDRFFDHKCDKLLNPFEKNSEQWLPWNDCFEAADFHDIASSFSNYTPKLDDFFAKNAELVLSEALKLYQDDKDIIKLIHTIIYSDNRQFAKAFRNTAVSGIISESALETSAGI